MAVDDIKYEDSVTNIRTGMVDQVIRVYKAATAVNAGKWIDVRGVESAYFQIRGITTGTVQVWGINPDIDDNGTLEARPADETGAVQIGSDITADGVVKFDRHELPAFIKFKISVATSISLDVVGRVLRHGKGH